MADQALPGKSLTWRFLIPGPDIGCQSRRFPFASPWGHIFFLPFGSVYLRFLPLNPAGPDALFNPRPNLAKSSNTQHSLKDLALVVPGSVLDISFLSFMNVLWVLPKLGHRSGCRLHHENDGISHHPSSPPPPQLSLDTPRALDTAAVQALFPSSAHEVYCRFPNMAQPTLLVLEVFWSEM